MDNRTCFLSKDDLTETVNICKWSVYVDDFDVSRTAQHDANGIVYAGSKHLNC